MMIYVRRNFGYKLVSVLIAILLYFIANNQLNPHTSNEVYILPDVVGLPDDEVIRTAPAGFTMTVAGPTASVNAYKTQTVKASVDVSGARVGSNKLPITYKLPPTGDLDISGGPPYAEVTIEHKARREWFVDVVNENEPPPGYVYAEPQPTKVKVTGLPTEVSRVARVIAVVPKTSGLGEIDENVTLVAQTESLQTVDTVQIDPPRAEVRISLKPESSSKTVVLSALLHGLTAPGYAVVGCVFSPSQVTVTGSRETLANLPALTVRVDVTGLTKSENRRVPIELPSGLALEQPTTPMATLRLEVEPVGGGSVMPTPTGRKPPEIPIGSPAVNNMPISAPGAEPSSSPPAAQASTAPVTKP